MLTQSMAKADALVNEKNYKEAAAVWKALIVLYEQEQNEQVQKIVNLAKENLANLPKPVPAEQATTDSQKASPENE